ncbi:hypothetical protein [Spongiactinospora sp. TRM90649]|uniref:hypothetical protein n=1 Tax=Spongiactinospora sp. TRM90649 TaxID=3031114 RepID=UPI0023FA005E|nr:hypothetical protein [Spongiactinospora sp. TRM90649]MDF5751545.1 hypothetical protein [Spongiactinospora sp. TRM90649]
MRILMALVAVLLLAVLNGCGLVGAQGAGPSASPSALLPCPEAADSPAPGPCVTMPSWEQKHAGNRAYRQRHTLSPETAAAAEPVAEALRGRFAGLRERELHGEAHVAKAVRAVAPEGTHVIMRAGGARSAVEFAIALPGGCLTGFYDERESKVEVGGFINDGGCLAAPGH